MDLPTGLFVATATATAAATAYWAVDRMESVEKKVDGMCRDTRAVLTEAQKTDVLLKDYFNTTLQLQQEVLRHTMGIHSMDALQKAMDPKQRAAAFGPPPTGGGGGFVGAVRLEGGGPAAGDVAKRLDASDGDYVDARLVRSKAAGADTSNSGKGVGNVADGDVSPRRPGVSEFVAGDTEKGPVYNGSGASFPSQPNDLGAPSPYGTDGYNAFLNDASFKNYITGEIKK